jgi:dienelactone hydrolase
MPCSILAAALLLQMATDPPLGEQIHVEPRIEEKDLPPPVLWDDFRYGPRHGDRIERVINPIKGRPPVVVTLYGHRGLSGASRYETPWLDHYLFDRKLLSMRVRTDYNFRRNGVEHVATVAAGIGEIVRRASKLGYDAERIVLVGNGWGAQWAALLATDPSWLEAAGVPLSSIRAVILLDGSGLDLEAERTVSGSRLRKEIDRMLDGQPPARLSPLRHAEAPNARRFLFYVAPDDPESAGPSETLAEALRRAGAEVEVKRVRRTRSRVWPSYPGHPEHSEREALARFLREAVSLP